MHIHTYIRTYIRTYIHDFTHACTHTSHTEIERAEILYSDRLSYSDPSRSLSPVPSEALHHGCEGQHRGRDHPQVVHTQPSKLGASARGGRRNRVPLPRDLEGCIEFRV